MSIQIKKKFIGSQVIDGSKILFLNEEAFKALDQSGNEVSLFKVDSTGKFQLLQTPKLSSDPVAAEDVSRKGYVDDQIEVEMLRAQAAEEVLSDAIDALAASGGSAVSGVQSELDATQVGAGLSTSGAYVAPVGSNFIDTAVSLKDADDKLDAALKAEETARIAGDDFEVSRAMAAELALDQAIAAEEARAEAAEADLAAEDLTFVKLDGSRSMTSDFDMGGNAIINVGSVSSSGSLSLTGAGAATITADDLTFAVSGVVDFGASALTNIGDGVAASDAASKGQLDAAVDAEEARAMLAESALDARLDIIEGADSVEGSVAKAEKDAKDYTDAREVVITAAYQAYADQAEVDAKAYADQKVADLVDSAPAVLDTLNELAAALGDDANFATTVAGQIGDVAADLAQEIIDRAADVDAEEARALAAEGVLQAAITAEEAARIAGDDFESSRAIAAELALDQAIAAEEARAEAEEATLLKLDGTRPMTGNLNMGGQDITDVFSIWATGSVETGTVQLLAGGTISFNNADGSIAGLAAFTGSEPADYAAPKSYVDSVSSDLQAAIDQEILDRTADVDAEQARAEAAEGVLSGRLDVLEGDSLTPGSVAKAEADAKAYADQKIADLVDGAPALLDTLNELAAAINDDENFAVTIAGQISALDSRADALEAASVEFKPVEKFVLSSTDISNGYITLSYLAIQHSLRVSVDRLAIHQGAGNDYTVSTVGGVTRITFVNSLVTPGQEQLSVGDEVYVEGAKLAIVTV